MINALRPYRGRFAPSPTGDLHFGSLVAAVASFLDARAHHGKWLVRIEDIDPPREVPGSATRILDDLARLGMNPDEEVLFQSTRSDAYESAINKLLERGDAFWCGCSRSDLPPSGIYPGTCHQGLPPGRKARSVRLRTSQAPVKFEDRIQGTITTNLARSAGDFVIRRADGLPAYQLAVAVDDAFQGMTHIVRGADLLDSTARQVFLQQQLNLPTPEYAHIPVAVDDSGAKLSKRGFADPVRTRQAADAVSSALKFLGHEPPQPSKLDEVWGWAMCHWNLEKVQRTRRLPFD